MSCFIGVAIVFGPVGSAEVLQPEHQQNEPDHPEPIAAIGQKGFDTTPHRCTVVHTSGRPWSRREVPSRKNRLTPTKRLPPVTSIRHFRQILQLIPCRCLKKLVAATTPKGALPASAAVAGLLAHSFGLFVGICRSIKVTGFCSPSAWRKKKTIGTSHRLAIAF